MSMIAEKYQMDFGVLTDFTGGVSTGVRSHPYQLAGCKRIAVLCAATMTATGSSEVGSSFKIMAGVATEGAASFTSVAGLNVVVGNASATKIDGVQAVKIVAHNSYASGKILILDGVTYTFHANCTASDKSISCSDSSGVVHGIATVLKLFATYLETSIVTSGATNSALIIRAKRGGAGDVRPGFNIQVTANATGANTLSVTPEEDIGVIQFKPEDILATNSSYTQFCVRVQSSVTAGHRAFCLVLRELAHGTSYSTAKQSTLHQM